MANGTQRQPVANIELHPDVLEPIGPEYDPESRFLGTLIVDRTPHHFELLEVVMHEEHGQVAKHSEYDDILTHHHLGAGADGPFATIELRGREYAVLVEPFCR